MPPVARVRGKEQKDGREDADGEEGDAPRREVEQHAKADEGELRHDGLRRHGVELPVAGAEAEVDAPREDEREREQTRAADEDPLRHRLLPGRQGHVGVLCGVGAVEIDAGARSSTKRRQR